MSFSDYEAPGQSRPADDEPRLRVRRSELDVQPASDHNGVAPVDWNREYAWAARPSKRWLLRSMLALVGLGILLVGLAIGTGMWLRHAMRAALPQLDGSLHVSGLSAEATVTRNAQGVPSIQAANLDDLLFAQGFVTAQDRLWQMDALRRHAAGELAEILGSRLVEHDRTQRILQIRASADRALNTLPPEQLHQLQAYANGVNAFIGQSADKLPVELRFLHYKPAPWTPRDSLLVELAMFQDLSTQFPVKMKRELLTSHLPADVIADMYPVGSWRDRPPTQPRPDLTTPKPSIEEIPLDDTQVRLERPLLATPEDVLRVAAELPGNSCSECRAGSNNWAVSASRSASGAPLLSNDMHLSLSVPDIWFEAGLHAGAAAGQPAFDVVGFTLPGAPFVVVGRNAHVAWGFTNLGADVQDVRIEHTRGSGNDTEYQKPDGSWAPVAHIAEHIRVRGGRDVTVDVQTTTAKVGDAEIVTPVISPLYPSEHRTLSLAWTAYDPANVSIPFSAVNSAADGASLVVAFASFGGPTLNLVYADEKHIGYHAIGRMPIRGSLEKVPRPVVEPKDTKGQGPADEDGNDDPADQAEPQVSSLHGVPFANMFHASSVQAAYRPQRRRRAEAAPEPRRKVRRVEAPRERRGEPRKPIETKQAEVPIPAVIPPLDYTVGLPPATVPVDATAGAAQWVGYIPYNELPSIADPPSGVLATANARITPDDYPYTVANDWMAPYRTERIYKLLEARRELTPADMLALQNDVRSEYGLAIAQRLAYALDHASPDLLRKDARRLHQAADLLRQWNGEMTPDSSAAAIVLTFRNTIWPMLLLPKMAVHDGKHGGEIRAEDITTLYQWGEQAIALELLLQHTPRRWLPHEYTSWDDLLAAAVTRGLNEAHAPSDLARWRYGSLYQVEINHPVFSMSGLFDRLLGLRTGTGLHETSGGTNTIRAVGRHFGPSERFDADLSSPEAALGNITTGQSGNPASPWYMNQFEPWLKGTSFSLPLHETGSTHTLTLQP